MANKLAGNAAVIQINTDENQRLAERYGIRDIPAMFAIKQGKVIGQTVGGMSEDGILDWFGKYL